MSGVFAGAEIAVVSLRSSRIEELVRAGSLRARGVERLRKTPEQFLAAAQIGVALFGAAASALAGARLVGALTPALARVELFAPRAELVSIGVVAVLVAAAMLVFGSLIPKSLALRFAEGYALTVAWPLLALSWIVRPAVWGLTGASNLVLRPFGDRTTFAESRLSSDELQHLVNEAAQKGALDPHAGEIASRAFDFAELTVAQVMVPRSRVVIVSRGASMEEVRRIVLEKGHTRMPVCEGELDNVVGYVSVKDVIAISWERALFILEDIVRPAYFVAQTMRAVTLLNEMRRRRMQLAIVVDELGALSGIVTLEDLIEELVGEIFSEHDPGGSPPILREADGAALVDGATPVREVNKQLGLELPESAAAGAEGKGAEGKGADGKGKGGVTIGALCVELAGKVPAIGEKLEAADGTMLEIADASGRKVRAVRVRRRGTDAAVVT